MESNTSVEQLVQNALENSAGSVHGHIVRSYNINVSYSLKGLTFLRVHLLMSWPFNGHL